MSRAKPVLALLGLVCLIAACGPASRHASGSGPSPGAATTTTSTTTLSAPSSAPTTGSASLGYLTGYGATQAVWYQSHTPDPDGGGFFPRLGNGDDTYTGVQFTKGRALAYTEHLYPPVPIDQALSSVGDELPFDATVVHNGPSPPTEPACEQVVETSPTLQSMAGVEVLAELRSDTSTLDTGAVSEISFQPFTGPPSSLPGC
ncbi:MAG: hypothetical protein J2O39_04620 [Acidimicrobiales bacterium]|nr:hypothetical protein [Acidimicrobiales bacterium]